MKCTICQDLLYQEPSPSSVLELNIEKDDGDDEWEDGEASFSQDIVIIDDDEDGGDDL